MTNLVTANIAVLRATIIHISFVKRFTLNKPRFYRIEFLTTHSIRLDRTCNEINLKVLQYFDVTSWRWDSGTSVKGEHDLHA